MHSIHSRLQGLALLLPVLMGLMVVAPAVARAEAVLAVGTNALADGRVGASYAQTLTATGGTPPTQWTISAGALPAGLTLVATTGAISGTPTAAGDSAFTVQATDAASHVATQALSIRVQPTETTVSARVLAVCANDVSAQPALGVLCPLYRGDLLPAAARPLIGRVILQIAGAHEDAETHVQTVKGHVAAITGATLSVETKDGVQAVLTNAGTTFSRDGKPITLAEIKVGDKIRARGTPNAGGGITAATVSVRHDSPVENRCDKEHGQRGEHGLAKGLHKHCRDDQSADVRTDRGHGEHD